MNLPLDFFLLLTALLPFVVTLLVFIYRVNYGDTYYTYYIRNALLGKNRKILFQSKDVEKAHEIANLRRQKIKEILAKDSKFNFYEFIETPPGFEPSREQYFEKSKEDRISQIIRLKWQVENDALLLAERVVDAIVFFIRDEQKFNPNLRYPTVKLVKNKNQFNGILPWSVVISTSQYEFFKEKFKKLENWFSIGIEFEPELPVELFGRCKEGFGMEGTAGGTVVASNGSYGYKEEYAMTCSHVLSNTCKSVFLRGEPTRMGQQPDAALIRIPSPCFPMERNYQKQSLACASGEDIDNLILNRAIVRKIPPANIKPSGIINSRILAFNVNGTLYRFPHLQILPKLTLYGGLIVFPIFNRHFSKQGDSGSWVIDEKDGRWIGMVVAGEKYSKISYVAESKPLVEYFEAIFSGNNQNVTLNPMRC